MAEAHVNLNVSTAVALLYDRQKILRTVLPGSRLDGRDWLVKALVVYYSNSGTTRTVANRIAEAMGADMEEILERKHRAPLLDEQGKPLGGFGMARAAMPAVFGLGSAIEADRADPSAYDIVIVGTPVWAGAVVPAVRTYVKRNRKNVKSIALFCTCGQTDRVRAISQMARLVGQEPLATLVIPAADVKSGECDEAVEGFTSRIEG